MHSRVLLSILALTLWASAAFGQIPNPGMQIDPANTFPSQDVLMKSRS